MIGCTTQYLRNVILLLRDVICSFVMIAFHFARLGLLEVGWVLCNSHDLKNYSLGLVFIKTWHHFFFRANTFLMISSFLLVATFSAAILTQIDEKRKTEWQTKYKIQYRNWCMVNITEGTKSHHKAVIYSNSQMPSMAIVLQSARDQSPLTAVVCPISM